MQKSYIMIRITFLSLFLLSLVACGPSTHIVDSWRDPNVVIDTADVHQFVVGALLKNPAIRRQVEDDMAARFPGKAVQSYKELGEAELKEDEEVYNQKLKRDGFDGVVLMRLVDVNNSTRYVPGNIQPYYRSWRGYWRYSWTGFYDAGYYTTDKAYDVEITVYSLKRNKLIWTANTTTINPPDRGELFTSVSKVVLARMKKEGFLR